MPTLRVLLTSDEIMESELSTNYSTGVKEESYEKIFRSLRMKLGGGVMNKNAINSALESRRLSRFNILAHASDLKYL